MSKPRLPRIIGEYMFRILLRDRMPHLAAQHDILLVVRGVEERDDALADGELLGPIEEVQEGADEDDGDLPVELVQRGGGVEYVGGDEVRFQRRFVLEEVVADVDKVGAEVGAVEVFRGGAVEGLGFVGVSNGERCGDCLDYRIEC